VRAGYSRRSTGNPTSLSAKCQAEKRDLAIGISLLYEFELKTLNERFLWSMKTDRKQKQRNYRRTRIP